MSFSGPSGEPGGATFLLDPVKQGARRAGDGTVHLRGEGWLTPRQMVEGDTESYLLACTPDPADEPD